MFRVTVLSGKAYAVQVDDLMDDEDNIEEFVASGDVVLLCEDLEDLEPFGIDDVQIVEED